MKEFYKTERLILRKPQYEDAEAIFAYASQTEVTRYLSWPTHRSLKDTYDFWEMVEKDWEEKTGYALLIENKKTGEVLGSTAVMLREGGGEVGYLIKKHAWGKGITAELLTALIGFAFEDQTQLEQIRACAHPDNTASFRVMEKAGMKALDSCQKPTAFPNLGTSVDAKVACPQWEIKRKNK